MDFRDSWSLGPLVQLPLEIEFILASMIGRWKVYISPTDDELLRHPSETGLRRHQPASTRAGVHDL